MLDEQLEHLIRASGAIIGDREVVVIGSQSILPWLKKYAGKPPKTFPRSSNSPWKRTSSR